MAPRRSYGQFLTDPNEGPCVVFIDAVYPTIYHYKIAIMKAAHSACSSQASNPPASKAGRFMGTSGRQRSHLVAKRLLQTSQFTSMPHQFTSLPPQHREPAPWPLDSTGSSRQQQLGPMGQSTTATRHVDGPARIQAPQHLPSADPSGPGVPVEPDPLDPGHMLRMTLRPQGWRLWSWKGHDINWTCAQCLNGHSDDYIVANKTKTRPPVVLLHGFGGSVYHWRRTLPALAGNGHAVYALDALGFGWSAKPDDAEYSGYDIWAEQVIDFLGEVVGATQERRVVLVGNSLGGFTALQAAAARPDVIAGVVVLNACGSVAEEVVVSDMMGAVGSTTSDKESMPSRFMQTLRTASGSATDTLLTIVATAYFHLSRRPGNVRRSLQRLYVDHRCVDDELVNSVVSPSLDPGAFAVCKGVLGSMFSVDPLDKFLRGLKHGCVLTARSPPPMLVIWGTRDPWMPLSTPERIVRHYGEDHVTTVHLHNAGHCPHDDATASCVNHALLDFPKRV